MIWQVLVFFRQYFTQGEKKAFGKSWDRTRVLLLGKLALEPIDLGSSGGRVCILMISIVLLTAYSQSWLFKNVCLLFPEALVSYDN